MTHKVIISLDRAVFKELKQIAMEDGVSPAQAAAGIIEDFIQEERLNPVDDSK